MCGKFHTKTIFIIEDVNFEGLDKKRIQKAAAIPLYLEGVDSSPVTMWAEIK